MMIFVYSAFIYVIMALPVINTIFVIVILLFDIKPFIKTVINEFKEITK